MPVRVPPIAQLAGQSAEAAALREVSDTLASARAEGRMVVDVALGDVVRDHLVRDRVALEREALDALKASLADHGQRVPAEITPLADGRYGLISGWRRLQALSELHAETGEARFGQLRALLRPPGEAAAAYTAMVEENELRAALSYYERARIVAEAAARGVFPDQSAALRGLFATASRAKRSKIGSFIDIHEALGDVLAFPAEIPERLGLALVSRLRFGEKTWIRAALAEARPETAAAELALLEELARGPQDDVSRAKQDAEAAIRTEPLRETLRPGLEMTVRERNGRFAVTLTGAGVDDDLIATLRAALGS
jgi:hypothetical protein